MSDDDTDLAALRALLDRTPQDQLVTRQLLEQIIEAMSETDPNQIPASRFFAAIIGSIYALEQLILNAQPDSPGREVT